jgi:hypothetical protein
LRKGNFLRLFFGQGLRRYDITQFIRKQIGSDSYALELVPQRVSEMVFVEQECFFVLLFLLPPVIIIFRVLLLLILVDSLPIVLV